MTTNLKIWVAILALLITTPVAAALNIFACTPEWGALSKEIGGDKATVYNATNALQDPHRVEARPSLIARARSADLVVCTGAQLEIGWLPLVLTQAGNAKIQVSQAGYFEVARTEMARAFMDKVALAARSDPKMFAYLREAVIRCRIS